MDSKTLSDLIGLIYDTARDINHWPRLLAALSNEISSLMDDDDESNQRGGNGLIDLLGAHLNRAVEINRDIVETREAHTAMESLLDRLPLTMIVVDKESRVTASNDKLNPLLSDRKGIYVENNVLGAGSPNDTKRLRELIRTVAGSRETAGRSIHLSSPDAAVPLSAVIVPLGKVAPSASAGNHHVAVLIAAPRLYTEVPVETLRSLYRLTRAEAKLVSSLIRDLSLDAIAEDFGISKHTIRNQLKSVYEKTGTHRQAELVREIITGPAMLTAAMLTAAMPTAPFKEADTAGSFSPASIQSKRGMTSMARMHQTMRLPDGRRLGFAEYGIPGGRPVMLMHAACGSRFERHPDDTIAVRCGVRLIIPDRPGIGLSEGNRNSSFLDWASDVQTLADHLSLGKFGVIGNSLGAAFALAAAHQLQDRISRLVIVAGVAPFESVWELGGMYSPYRVYLSLGKLARPILEPLSRLIRTKATAEMYQKELYRDLPPVDRALVNDIAIRSLLMENVRENLRQEARYILPEVLMTSNYWGFELDEIKAPTEIWHGEMDRIVPLKLARNTAERLPNSRSHFLPGAGHFLLFHCWRQILLCAISEADH